MATTGLRRTLSGNGSQTTATFSFWVKRGSTANDARVYTSWYDANNQGWITFTNNTVGFFIYQSSSYSVQVRTNRVFRDTNAWYHVLFAIDTTQGTAADRVKIYINGTQETSMAQTDYPASSQSLPFGLSSYNQRLGERSGDDYFDGCMSHFHFIDGTAYDASEFGETDSTTGEWKINPSPSVTYGTNGFFILKDGNGVTDQSGNSNNWTVNTGTLTDLKDNPSHNFCNINGLYNQTVGQGVTINNCGNTVYYASDSSRSAFGSIAPSSGKYYFEAKVFDKTRAVIGIVNMAWTSINGASGYGYHDNALNFGYDLDGQKTSGGSASAFGSALNNNDIVQVAMDLDNSKLYFGINGTWQNSGDPTSGSTGTGSAYNLASGANYTAACRLRAGTQIGFNFGNGQFSGSSVVSSEGTNASGHGKFEYDVPTGYTALSTKGLNE